MNNFVSMELEKMFETRYPIMIEWSNNYSFVAPFISFIYELSYYIEGKKHIKKIYDDLVKHGALMSNLEEELQNSDNNKRKLASKIYDVSLNVGGYYRQTGITNDGLAVQRLQDVWKFNPEQYTNRWLSLNSFNDKNKLYKWIVKQGLKDVDFHGTPIITKVPWVPQ